MLDLRHCSRRLRGKRTAVRLRMALGIAIYGMFLAIIVPPLRRNRGVAIAVFSAAAMSCILRYMPLLNKISRGFAIIICAVAGSALAAAAVPVSQEDNDAGNVGCDGLGTDNAATAGRREEN